jgi:isopentenyldiphosphate isomerase
MADELVDIYNENFELIGSKMKSEARRNGHWVSSIHCWIIRPNSGGYVLFQKRGALKKIFPNTLDISAAGHYKSGEKEYEGIREISEELGLNVDYNDLIPLGVKIDVAKVGENTVHEFCRTFLYQCNKKPNEYNLDLEEVEGLVEISIQEGLALFSGEKDSIEASGVEYNKDKNSFEPININVKQNSFIPRVDSYYYKIFIMADRFLKGEKYIAI